MGLDSTLDARRIPGWQVIATGTLTVRKTGSIPFEFSKIEFNDIVVLSGGDEFSFTYGSIKVTEIPQKADGSAGAAITFGWDVKANKSL